LFVFPRVATIADAAELFYPGTFDPFHNTHYQEVLGELKKDPSLKVTILPVEDAFYNRQAGLPRPLFFPYDDKVAILRDSFSGYPHVQV
ncbi:hypothetical protein KHT87_22325, partial [Alkalihalobacillus clausii]|uniref:hypothetical protein n=1 Tax=Shouchella clausii TaxID=79880 RepID=UPI001C0E1DC4